MHPQVEGLSLKEQIERAVLAERNRCIAYVERCRDEFRRLARLQIKQDIVVAADTIAEGLKKL